ncbi:MAG: class B sortase [Oscillospiraceae bacterium]|nr:class B sortase [Oscillospiraceae bacterium]
MALSRSAKKAYKKAVKEKKKRRRGHWLLIQRGDSAKEIASKIFTQLALIVLIACVAILGNELRLSLSAQFLNSSLKDIYESFVSIAPGNGKITESAEQLLKINEDTVGWVQIDDTNISLPVVQRKTSDGNEYYLTHAFDGSKNKAGTIFLDYRATLDSNERSDNLVLYGHNQRDKTMFGDLAYYKHDLEYYQAHPTITFSSNYTADTYKIFACFVTPVLESQTSDGVIFDYHNYIDFSGQAQYNEFIGNIMERTQIITAVDVQYGDSFLTLSTCSNEFEPSRFVVIARRTRDGEEPTVDTSAAYVNENAKEPEWDVIYGR